MMKRIAIANELCTQGHRNVGIVEDGLRMDKIDQVVVLEASGIVEWHCARLGRWQYNKQILWCRLTQVEICEGVEVELDSRVGNVRVARACLLNAMQ